MTTALRSSLQFGVTGGHADAVGTGHNRKRVWMPSGAWGLTGGSQYPASTRNGGRVAKLRERAQLGRFVQFKMKHHNSSFLQVSKALCSRFVQNDTESATEKLFPKQNHFVFSKNFLLPFRPDCLLFWHMVLVSRKLHFLDFYSVYKPPSFSPPSHVPGLIL